MINFVLLWYFVALTIAVVGSVVTLAYSVNKNRDRNGFGLLCAVTFIGNIMLIFIDNSGYVLVLILPAVILVAYVLGGGLRLLVGTALTLVSAIWLSYTFPPIILFSTALALILSAILLQIIIYVYGESGKARGGLVILVLAFELLIVLVF